MTYLKEERVSIAPEIMQDQSYKSNHHILERITRSNEIGTIREFDKGKSEEQKANLYWVKFHMAAIRIKEEYLTKVAED